MGSPVDGLGVAEERPRTPHTRTLNNGRGKKKSEFNASNTEVFPELLLRQERRPRHHTFTHQHSHRMSTETEPTPAPEPVAEPVAAAVTEEAKAAPKHARDAEDDAHQGVLTQEEDAKSKPQLQAVVASPEDGGEQKSKDPASGASVSEEQPPDANVGSQEGRQLGNDARSPPKFSSAAGRKLLSDALAQVHTT